MSEVQIADQMTPEVEGLPAPPPILVLTMTTDLEGRSNLRYNLPPMEAAKILRAVADSVEAEISVAESEQAEGPSE